MSRGIGMACAGELLLGLTEALGRHGFEVALRIDVESAAAIYMVSVKVPKLGEWRLSVPVALQALAAQPNWDGLAKNMAEEVRKAFDFWCAPKRS